MPLLVLLRSWTSSTLTEGYASQKHTPCSSMHTMRHHHHRVMMGRNVLAGELQSLVGKQLHPRHCRIPRSTLPRQYVSMLASNRYHSLGVAYHYTTSKPLPRRAPAPQHESLAIKASNAATIPWSDSSHFEQSLWSLPAQKPTEDLVGSISIPRIPALHLSVTKASKHWLAYHGVPN